MLNRYIFCFFDLNKYAHYSPQNKRKNHYFLSVNSSFNFPMWQQLLQPDIQAFIQQHQREQVSLLALQQPPDKSWPWALILDQIKSRQKALQKIPQWLAHHPQLLFPKAGVLEQASSAATAAYKAGLVHGSTMVDLCAGAGVDAWAFSRHFSQTTCVEQDPHTAELLAHNLSLLCSRPVQVVCMAAEEYVQQHLQQAELVYLDPQRRNAHRKGLYRLADTSPNIHTLMPILSRKAHKIMLKASPMLDISLGIKELKCVEAVQVVAYRGECKELLFILNPHTPPLAQEQVPITAVPLSETGQPQNRFEFTRAEEQAAEVAFSAPRTYLFDPGPALAKAGAFGLLAARYGLYKLHPSTHLYTSDQPCPDFPGRRFRITGLTKVDKAAVKGEAANLSLKNFPGKVSELKKQLGLRDGGSLYLFACTIQDGKKKARRVLIHAQKAD